MPQEVYWVRGEDEQMLRDLAKLFDGNKSMAARVAIKEMHERRFGNGVKKNGGG